MGGIILECNVLYYKRWPGPSEWYQIILSSVFNLRQSVHQYLKEGGGQSLYSPRESGQSTQSLYWRGCLPRPYDREGSYPLLCWRWTDHLTCVEKCRLATSRALDVMFKSRLGLGQRKPNYFQSWQGIL